MVRGNRQYNKYATFITAQEQLQYSFETLLWNKGPSISCNKQFQSFAEQNRYLLIGFIIMKRDFVFSFCIFVFHFLVSFSLDSRLAPVSNKPYTVVTTEASHFFATSHYIYRNKVNWILTVNICLTNLNKSYLL